ncbi:MAG TPA: hypothetical protein EYH08_02690, partial [Pyrodictium sp.]|nr:hypothetical protein [Pyrodictium sp.]
MPSTRLLTVAILFTLFVSLFTPGIVFARAVEFQAFLNLLEEKLGRILPPNVPVLAIFLVSGKLEDFQMFSFAAIKGLYALSQWLGYESPKIIEWFRKLRIVPIHKTFTLNGVEVTSIPILTSYGSVVELAEKLRDRLLALVVKPIPKLETLPLDDQTLNMLLRDGLVLSNYDVRQLIGVSKVEEI